MAGIVVPPEVARLGIQAAEIRKRITAKLVAQQKLRAMAQMQAQAQAAARAQQGGPPQGMPQGLAQGMPQPSQAQADPYDQAQAMQQQAVDYQEEQRRQAMLDALQKGGS